MKLAFARRKVGIALALSMVLAAVLVPMAPAAADANDFWSLETDPINIRRDGETYQMWIGAYDEGNAFESMGVNFTQRRNPDGIAQATQLSQFSFILNAGENRFRHPENNLSRASLFTGNDLGVYGRIDLAFQATGDLISRCDGHNRTRRGAISGTVDFKSRTGLLQRVTVEPTRATLKLFDGECTQGGGGNPCPTEGREISGTRDNWTFYAFRTPDSVSVTATKFAPLDDSAGYLSSELNATLPESKMNLGDGLLHGSVSGMAGTYLSGRSEYTGSNFDNSAGWFNCGGDKERTVHYSEGRLDGNLTVNWFLHNDTVVGTGNANAARTIVRPR